MNKSLQLIGRFAVILLGYGCAVLAAGFLLNMLIIATIGSLPDAIDDGFVYGYWPGLLIATPFMALIISYFAFWPALAVIAAGEFFHKRDSLFYCLGGLLTGIILFMSGFQAEVKNATETMMLMSMAAAGITGGFIYWLVAGRWTNVTARATTPEPR